MPPSESGARWELEVIRQVEPKDLYGTQPFEKTHTVVGLLDHQIPCTLVRPLIYSVDPGSLGVRYLAFRTRLKGRFSSFISGLAIDDIDAKVFTGASFASDAFEAWYSLPAYQAEFDVKKFKHKVSIRGTQKKTFRVNGVGVVTCLTRAHVASAGRASNIKSIAAFTVDFYKPLSLQEVETICHEIETLFGFLVGFRSKPPIFRIRLNDTYQVGDQSLPLEGELQIGGVDWQSKLPPHPFDCIHLNGLGKASLRDLLVRFMKDRENLMTRMMVVEFSRHFAKNLQESFSIVMPVLEQYVKAKYSSEDEVKYLGIKKKFFDLVDGSGDAEIGEFCRKHVQIREGKAPSLKTLLGRAISAINRRGFNFPEAMAARLQKRRGELFHSAPKFDQLEAINFASEVQAATGLLMLHTFMDLGIDVRVLASRWTALSDIREFLRPPKSTGSRNQTELNES